MLAYSYYESDPRVIREAEAAVEAGYSVDFLALRKPGTPAVEVINGVNVIRLNQSKYRGVGRASYAIQYLKFFARSFAAITKLTFRSRYGVVHVNNMPDFLVFATLAAKLRGSSVILDIHDPMPNTFASKFKGRDGGFFFWLLLWQERLSAFYSDQVVTVHDPVKDGILVKHGLRADQIAVVANFADDALFSLRQNYVLGERIRFVFHGTILERSGLKLLMQALSMVRRKDRIKVRIIGEGDFSDELNAMIASSNLSDVVEFDNRSYPVRQIPGRIEDCTVGLVPLEISSVTDYALPLKLVEYISMGLPVLAVRNAAISYYLGDDDCIFFEPNNAESLAQAIDRVACDPDLLLKYRERSVALRERFSWTAEKTKYQALLNRLDTK